MKVSMIIILWKKRAGLIYMKNSENHKINNEINYSKHYSWSTVYCWFIRFDQLITHQCDWTNSYDSVDVLTQVWVMVGGSYQPSSPLKILELQMYLQPMQFTVRLFSLITLVQEELSTRIIFLATLLCKFWSLHHHQEQYQDLRGYYTLVTIRETPDALCAFITFWLKLDKAENCNRDCNRGNLQSENT